MYSIEVRKITVNTKLYWIHLFVVPETHFYCIVIALSEFVAIKTYNDIFLQRLAYLLQNIDDFSGMKYYKMLGFSNLLY